MPVPGWNTQPLVWSRMSLDGVPVPGVAVVRGGHERREDTLEAPGEDGATVTHLGYGGAVFDVEVLMWTDEHARQWERIYTLFRPRREASLRAVAVAHPAFQMAGVRQLYVRRITTAEPDRLGVWRASIELVEFVPRRKRRKGRAGEIQPSGPDVDITALPVAEPPSRGPAPSPRR